MKQTVSKYIILFSVIFLGCFVIATAKKDDCEGGNCKPLPIPIPDFRKGSNFEMVMQRSCEPNELKGPVGVDSVRWVSINDELTYTVYFENDPVFATASAQVVDIHINMPDRRLLKDFKLGDYAFSNREFKIPDFPNFYSMRVDVRDTHNIYVDLTAGMEVENSKLYWRFASIDPESGHAPWQVDRGMLPVNDSNNAGEGFVIFKIKPYPEMVTGDTLSFFAKSAFDATDTISTNRWCNKIDAGAPTSKIISKVNPENFSNYKITFDAKDDEGGCGVGRVKLYLADNLGNYQEYADCPPDTVIDFNVEKGQQYKLMAIATDRVGNREKAKSEPDIILNFNEPPTDIILSNTTFQDDIMAEGFIAELSTVDSDNKGSFTYALAEGEGAVHNDMFAVRENRLVANDCFKCADETEYKIRLSTTDDGGLTFSKPFVLKMKSVLERPTPVVSGIQICEGEKYLFHGKEYSQTGRFEYRKPNEFMCDSIYILNLTVNPIPSAPTVTVTGRMTLTSSAERGNQWYKDGEPIAGATDQTYTASETGKYFVTASNGSCESDPSDEFYVNVDDITELRIPLPQGWSWFSSNIIEPSAKSPSNFFASILSKVNRVLGPNGDLSQAQGKLTGSLTSIENSTYKISMEMPGELVVKGGVADVTDATLQLSTGWNWIPYIPTMELDITQSLAGNTPNENDIIKSHSEFAVFSNGKWQGTLTKMKPGEGYIYYASKPTTLKYADTRAAKVATATYPAGQNQNGWQYKLTDFKDNMTVIADLIVDGSKPYQGAFSVGAFCGNTCRGIGSYVDGKIFISIHGNEGDRIEFKVLENATNTEATARQTVTFSDTHSGSMAAPFNINVDMGSGVDDTKACDIVIYPNPVRDVMYIQGDTSEITEVKIISLNGEVLITSDSIQFGVNVSTLSDGVYLAAFKLPSGTIYKKFVKK